MRYCGSTQSQWWYNTRSELLEAKKKPKEVILTNPWHCEKEKKERKKSYLQMMKIAPK